MKKLSLLLLTVLIFTACSKKEEETTQSEPKETGKIETPKETAKADKSIVEYIEQRYDNLIPGGPENADQLVEVVEIDVDDCPENPDGPCGFPAMIYADKNWETQSEKQTFYIVTQGGAGMDYSGPYTDNIQALLEEHKSIGSIKIDPAK